MDTYLHTKANVEILGTPRRYILPGVPDISPYHKASVSIKKLLDPYTSITMSTVTS